MPVLPQSFDVRFLPPAGHKPRRLALVFLALTPFLIGLCALYLGQDANWDLRNYHWYNAYAFLTGRYATDLLPSQTPFFYNPAIDVPFYWLATHLSARLTTFIMGTLQGLNGVLLFMLAYAALVIHNPKRKVLVALALSLTGLFGGGGIAQIGTTFYDNVTSLGIFGSALLALRFAPLLTAGPAPRAALRAFVAGIPAGVMMGLKLPSVVFCVGLCAAMLTFGTSWQRRLQNGFFFGLGVLVGLAVSFSYWGWFLQTNFGSPLFPYFNDIFKSPLAPITSGRDTQFIPQTLRDALLYPFIFLDNPLRTGEIPWRDIRLPLLYVLMPLAALARLLFGRNPANPDGLSAPGVTRFLMVLVAVSYVVWVKMFAIYRYALPLEMLAPLLIVLSVGILPVRPQTRGLLGGFLIVAVIFCVQPGNWTRRATFSDHFVEVTRPDLPADQDIMLLMAGYEPYAHVLTAFPPEIPVVRVQSNFARPDIPIGMNDRIRDKIVNHKGSFKLLIPAYQSDLGKAALAAYGLVFLPQTCQKVVDHLYKAELTLCDVKRARQAARKP